MDNPPIDIMEVAATRLYDATQAMIHTRALQASPAATYAAERARLAFNDAQNDIASVHHVIGVLGRIAA